MVLNKMFRIDTLHDGVRKISLSKHTVLSANTLGSVYEYSNIVNSYLRFERTKRFF